MEKYDVIILGTGPNGLTAGAYLTKAGLKVLLLENGMSQGEGLIPRIWLFLAISTTSTPYT